MNFKTRYSARVSSKGHEFVEESMTLQSEYAQTTIDYYLKRYSQTGILGDPNRQAQGEFLDVSTVGDFQEMQEKILAVRNAFMQLPAVERRMYGDDPANWVNAEIAKTFQEQESQKASEPVVDEKPAEQASAGE